MIDYTFEQALWARVERDIQKIREQSLLGPFRLRPLRWFATWTLEWKPHDCWIGAFWKRTDFDGFHGIDLWVCLLPMIPLHVWWYRRDDR